ncbi:phytase [Parahaliea mediterranea]|uniref:phytase n=1 Tax=Parahaliea mediterranea TaxID=651086 RepID=UPI0014761022|nr:phytase [Parahaliea mediterranea]
MTQHSRLKAPICAMTLFAAAHLGAAEPISVTATLETRPHFDDAPGNFTDVDDPAIWIHPQQPGESLVAGTLKEGGLDLYTLDGKLLQHIPGRPAPACPNDNSDCDNAPGRLNNAEVVYRFPLQGKPTDLVVASDRGLDTLAIFAMSPNNDGQYLLSEITASGVGAIFSDSQQAINEGYTAYGLATYQHQGKTMALVSQNSTTQVAVLELGERDAGTIGYTVVARLDFPHAFDAGDSRWTPCTDEDADRPQFEGMVADAAHNALYLAQENVGIWRIALDAPQDSGQWQLFARAAEFGVPYQRTWDDAEGEYACKLLFDQNPGLGDEHLRVDLEGLTIYDAGKGKGYLLVSSQGDNTVAVYDRSNDNTYLGSFRVDDGDGVDGVNETDGMMVTNVALGEAFPAGLLVMHDGDNQPQVYDENGGKREGSNFKFVDWADIAKPLNLPLNTGNRAR